MDCGRDEGQCENREPDPDVAVGNHVADGAGVDAELALLRHCLGDHPILPTRRAKT